jgi:micrococcal nuclease
MSSRTLVLALVTVALAAGCAVRGEETPKTGAAEVTVERIVDGDTLALADGRHVRLVQIDAPEEEDGECYAEEAAAELEELIPPGSVVELETDQALDEVDRFGRLLRYVVEGETNANLELVRRGAAAPWFFDGDRGRYADELLGAAKRAKESRRGLWAACPRARLDSEHGIDAG